jgi:hypothetical protein
MSLFDQIKALLGNEHYNLWTDDDLEDENTKRIICDRLIVPTTWNEDTYKSDIPHISSVPLQHLRSMDGHSMDSFVYKLNEDMVAYDTKFPVLHTAYDKSIDTIIESTSWEALMNENIHNIKKVNSSQQEPSVHYLRENMRYDDPHPMTHNILHPPNRNLTFALSPPIFDTRGHIDETSSLVHSLSMNTTVKLWIFIPNGKKEDIMKLNYLLGLDEGDEEDTMTNSLVTLLTSLPTAMLGLQLPGYTVYNPYNCVHAVLTRGADRFIGIAQQLTHAEQIPGWLYHLKKWVHEDMFDRDEIRDLLINTFAI